MKKIGVITYWNTEENYGQILQIYSLQQILLAKGVEPFLIKHIPEINKQHDNIIKRAIKVFSSLDRIKDAINKRKKSYFKREIRIVNRNFNSFKEKYIISTDKLYTYSDLLNNPPQFDCYICGSDQIWNYPSPIFLMNWVKKGTHKYSYAASFGKPSFPNYLLKEYQKSLTTFSGISVREKSGINICNQIGINNVIHVLDPTFLLSKEDYQKKLSISNFKHSGEKYIFLYLLGNKTNIDINYIKKYAKENNLIIKFVPSQNFSIQDLDPIYPTIQEWLELIMNAEVVITNSFHGTVFSIIFEKLFYTVILTENDSKMNERIISLFEDLKINQYFNNKIDLNCSLDYIEIKKRLKLLKDKSISYIDKILNNI